MPKLTKRVIDGIKPDTKETVVWDDELSGFGLRIKPSGRKTYVVQYRGTEKIHAA
ncbi:Arm DNA-binding domain-containing protein [Azospirillum lipoferum]|uniref:Arm DNA-binding domain-containing protein n=1 Tax=Azospirillum lipoferum TaxID=193 RepID=UPI0013964B4D|nr:Arm DNA-binding domain-containing protein [Azospirillum lipoferum]